ncbi:MAG: hypothetical protein ACLP52_27435 [Streptosporangiaceae bacterium]
MAVTSHLGGHQPGPGRADPDQRADLGAAAPPAAVGAAAARRGGRPAEDRLVPPARRQ